MLNASAQDNDRLMRFKAVFIYNFIDYVHWPETEFEEPFKIGLLGQSPLEDPLREIAKKRSSEGREMQVEMYDTIENIKECHLIFITQEHKENLDSLSAQLQGQNILTISDTPGLAKQGVSINFVLVKGKLKFEINRHALNKANLRASAQLLKLAILVDDLQ